MKKALILFIIALELINLSVVPVLAQEEASSSAKEVETITPTPSIPDVTPTSMAVEKLLDTTTPDASAKVRLRTHIRTLTKRTYKASEGVTLVVDNASLRDITAKLFDAQGRSVPVEVTEVSTTDPVVLKISHTEQFKPGRYHLEVSSTDGISSKQNFTWGVLAINPNKSIYSPYETSHLSIAVLDETGEMVCDATVSLHITSETLGIDDELSTDNGKIQVNSECNSKEFTLKPDYETNYQVGGVGVYSLSLTAETGKGSYTTTDSFEVRERVPFEIERTSATRIFPPLVYPMRIDVTAQQDFKGTITERVPGNFIVKPLEGVIPIASISATSVDPSEKAVLSAAVGSLSMPFEKTHKVSLGFGKELDDPIESKKYTDFGVIGHDGVDFDMPDGTPVLSVDDGEVVRTDTNGDYGQTVVIQHVWGKSYYGHLSRITTSEGKRIRKGYPLGMSGHSGLANGPHLHFGIKPNTADPNNGYYGKVDPAGYLGLQNISATEAKTVLSTTGVLSASTSAALDAGEEVAETQQVITWNVSVKKGEKFSLGYTYKVPNISPQFYLLGPLQFGKEFSEGRQWQLAIDADGSGTNSVTPTTGQVSATGNIYTFTFTTAEVMQSGTITITVPAGWSAPQGTAGTAGYTTAVGNGSAIVGDVEDTFESATGWTRQASTNTCLTTLAVDATTKQEGTNSLKCTNGNVSAGNFVFKNITSQNWSGYTTVGVWVRSSATVTSGRLQFMYDDTSGCGSQLETLNIGVTATNTWEYKVLTLGATTRTAVVCYGFVMNHASAMDSISLWFDYMLNGPGNPTFSGSGPWDITVPLVTNATNDTVTITYGKNGGTSGVTNPSSPGTSTFTTKSRTAITGTLTNISSSPTVVISSGPTLDQIMRHGGWFNNGSDQPFTF